MKITSALLILACFTTLNRVSFAQMNDTKSSPKLESAVFGGGCFWCLDAQFKLVNGVKSVLSGYAGGTTKNPSYEQVCSETTGHAEVIQVEFDPAIVSYEDLLRKFFRAHDPTTLNRQGGDVGTSYRSIILYKDENQKTVAEKMKAEAQKQWTDPIVTEIAPLNTFFKAEDYEEIPHDSMRKAIARRLTSAKTLIPHFYLTVDCRIDNLTATRARLNESAPKENGYKLSVNDFVVKSCALALMRVPAVNASWTETAILRHKHADVGVAVALDFGLITPIIFRAEEKGLAAISNEMKSLAERARTKKLKPQEFEGGSFAISNLGMFGIKDFTAVINPPHAAILAVGAGEKRAVVAGDKVESATVMTVTMSCDHRVIDGATGARFLQSFKQFIEEPASMLL